MSGQVRDNRNEKAGGRPQPAPCRRGASPARAVTAAAAAAVLAFATGGPARAGDVEWTGDRGNLWGDGLNWSPNRLPGPGDVAVFSGSVAQEVVLGDSSAVRAADAVRFVSENVADDPYLLSGGTLRLNA